MNPVHAAPAARTIRAQPAIDRPVRSARPYRTRIAPGCIAASERGKSMKPKKHGDATFRRFRDNLRSGQRSHWPPSCRHSWHALFELTLASMAKADVNTAKPANRPQAAEIHRSPVIPPKVRVYANKGAIRIIEQTIVNQREIVWAQSKVAGPIPVNCTSSRNSPDSSQQTAREACRIPKATIEKAQTHPSDRSTYRLSRLGYHRPSKSLQMRSPRSAVVRGPSDRSALNRLRVADTNRKRPRTTPTFPERPVQVER